MKRSTAIAVGLLVVLVAIGIAIASRAGIPVVGNSDRTVAGYFSSDDAITVQNLTIADGRYRVGYSMEVLYSPLGAGRVLRCTLEDTSGRIEFLGESVRDVPAGAWTPIAFNAVLDLPELTLGVRCSPSDDGLLSAVFRSVSLYAVVPSIFESD
jgi:hypothetical protein